MTAGATEPGDIPEQTAMQQSDFAEHLRAERDRFVAFAFAHSDILIELDAEQKVVFADGALRRLLGYHSDELVGRPFFELLANGSAEQLEAQINDLDIHHRLDKTKVVLFSSHGDVIPFSLSGFRLSHVHKHTYLALSLMRGDIPIDQILKRDLDSGLLNMSGFVETASERLQEAQEAGELLKLTLMNFPELSAFLADLKPEEAETLLKDISAYLKAHSLGGDMAGVVGKEAFSVMHDTNEDPSEMMQALVSMTREYDPKHDGIHIEGTTIDAEVGELTSRDTANVLLYTLTEFARAEAEDFSITSLAQSYDKLLEESVQKITHFKQTVRDEAFDLAFQPIVDLKSGLIHHYEVLVRMKKPEIFRNPFEFINFGEKTGVISDFDLIMTQRAFEVLKSSAKQGNHPIIAVNISGKSVSSSLFRDTLEALAKRNEKLRKQIIFEFTESARIEDMKVANQFIQALREGGSLCCLDDFGTGESSFEYLRALQVDFIKIDGSYVRESLQSDRGRHMLKAMAALCRDLNVTAIGEMVEDETAAGMLWDSGVKFGQGYLFGKPEIDEETLKNCKKPTPFYGGIMRARKVNN